MDIEKFPQEVQNLLHEAVSGFEEIQLSIEAHRLVEECFRQGEPRVEEIKKRLQEIDDFLQPFFERLQIEELKDLKAVETAEEVLFNF